MNQSYNPNDPVGLLPTFPATFAMPGVGIVPMASVGKRFLARIIDGIITLIFSAILIFTVGGFFNSGSNVLDLTLEQFSNPDLLTDPDFQAKLAEANTANVLTNIIITVLLGVILEVTLTTLKGGTPGKLMLGLRVASVEDGGRISYGNSAVRWIILQFFFLLPGIVINLIGQLIGLVINLSFLFDSVTRRGWQDKFAKTVVVDISAGAAMQGGAYGQIGTYAMPQQPYGTPAQPGQPQPGQPGSFGTPIQPGQQPPAQPGQPQPGQQPPAQPGQPQPGQPGSFGTPIQPGQQPPAQPGQPTGFGTQPNQQPPAQPGQPTGFGTQPNQQPPAQPGQPTGFGTHPDPEKPQE